MKKFKYLILLFIGVLSLCSFTNKTTTMSFPQSVDCHNEIKSRILNNELDYFHDNFLGKQGYYDLYWKMSNVTNQFDKFSKLSESKINELIKTYDEETLNAKEIVIQNLANRVSDLLPGQYVGLYWDATFGKKEDNTSYLYLIWTSEYSSSQWTILKSVSTNGNKVDTKTLDEVSVIEQYEEYNIDLHFSVIGGYQNGVQFGVKPTQNMQISGFESGVRPSLMGQHGDFTYFESAQKINFNLGLTPTQHGKDSLLLVTQNYKIIEDCEVQTHYSFNFGGYKHYAMFNTNIPIDKIYRVDVSYLITNDNKDWWQIFLPDNEYQIKKSLTAEKKSGGLFGLSDYQGFEEGSFQSTDSNAKNYKYRLHLNYDANAWNFFSGQNYNEADYKRVSDFQILRINYITDGSVNEIPVDMDPVEGESMLITNPDLIIDTESFFYDFKKIFDDIGRKISDSLGKFKWILYVILGTLGLFVILWVLAKFKQVLSILFKSNKGE